MGINSIDKVIEYVSRVSKEPVFVNGEVVLQKGITAVRVTDKFFAKDGCVVCGRCCLNENNAWTAEGYQRIRNVLYVGGEERAAINGIDSQFDMGVYEELMGKLEPVAVDINGKLVDFWQYPADKGKDQHRYTYEGRPANLPRCHWMDLSKPDFQPCTIHLCRSITCGLPHLRFYHTKNSETTSLSVSQYGRNHNIGCPIKFEPYDAKKEGHEDGVKSRMVWLERLLSAANDLGIDTWLPEILHHLKKGYRSEFAVGIPSHPTLFTVNLGWK